MLFRALDTYLLRNAPQRSMPHFAQYIETLTVRREILTARYEDAPGYENRIVVFLRKILADADIPTLLRKSSDFDCYFDILRYTEPGLSNIFDPVTTGLSFYDMLIRKSSTSTVEYYIPVQCEDVVATLPLDRGWEEWESVRPIRLVDVDSLELTFNTYQDQIVYQRDHPTRAVVTVDVVALVLQYVNFLQSGAPDLSQAEYIHRYVLIHLLVDLQNLWLGNLYDTVLSNPGRMEHDSIAALTGDGFYGFPGTELPIALREFTAMLRMCRGGVITPATFLTSLKLSHDSVPSFLRNLLITTSIADRRQNYWMEYLRDMRWLNLMCKVYDLQPDFVATRNLKTALRRDLPILYYQRFWQNCHDRKTSSMIEQDLKNRIAVL